MEKEGAVEARWLNGHGVEAFVLEYRLGPKYHFPAPMLDGARAVRYVRSHAAELGIAADKVGVWGFSAGGHLAGYLAAVNDEGEPEGGGSGGAGERSARLCDSLVRPAQYGCIDSEADQFGGADRRASDPGHYQ